MPSYVPCKKNDANGLIFYVSLVSQANTKIFQATPTLAAGDVQRAIDDAAPANLTTLPVVDADFTKRVKVTLSQAETNGDNITIIFSDAAGAEWCDLTINIQTSGQTLDEIDTVLDTAAADVVNIDGSPMIGTNNAALAASWTGALAIALGSYTAVRAGYLDELAAANIPADIDTLLTRLSAARALLLDEITAIRMAELDAANIPADIDTLLVRLSAIRAGYLDELAAANIPADIDTLLTRITEALTLAAIADAVWDELIAGHLAAGSTGAALNAASAAGDPWSIALPGVYADGTAGERLTTLSEKSTFNLS